MEEKENKTITILDCDGEEKECCIMFTYTSEESGLKYVAFTLKDDEDGIIVARINENDELSFIDEDSSEWDELEEVVDGYLNDHPEDN